MNEDQLKTLLCQETVVLVRGDQEVRFPPERHAKLRELIQNLYTTPMVLIDGMRVYQSELPLIVPRSQAQAVIIEQRKVSGVMA